MKERLRAEDAVYGGEITAHHYFRDFSYCDSGMIPWLLIAETLSQTGEKLSALVKERMQLFPCSGEINFEVRDTALVLDVVLAHYLPQGPTVDYTDGIGLSFPEWCFNIRGSNTEPLLRLNVETRNDEKGLQEHVEELSQLIRCHQ